MRFHINLGASLLMQKTHYLYLIDCINLYVALEITCILKHCLPIHKTTCFPFTHIVFSFSQKGFVPFKTQAFVFLFKYFIWVAWRGISVGKNTNNGKQENLILHA